MKLETIDKKIKTYSDKNPHKIAIRHGREEITYKKLEEDSNIIADFLIDNFNECKNVFVVMDKGIHLIKSIIGVIKAGGIFTNIDPTASNSRSYEMIKDLKPQWIITTVDLLDVVKSLIREIDYEINILLADEDAPEMESLSIYNLKDYKRKENGIYEYCTNKNCYVYFTSGSTGKPKGVLGRHKSLVQFIEWEIKEFNIDCTYNVSQLTPITFDPFLRDVFVPLCAGGTLYIPKDKEVILNPDSLIRWIKDNNINLIHMVPSLFRRMSNAVSDYEDIKSLKYILLAGELLRSNDVKKFLENFKDKIQIVNLYGPTETTLAKFFYRLKEDDIKRDIIPVGKPIDFCQAYIVDQDLNKCPEEVIGELYIRTPYISSGYCNNKEKTREVFMQNFFSNNPRDIIYKTGDLARKLVDGNIELVGRSDDQVKIRGMRIELGEIENNLLKIEGIKEVKVLAKEDEDKNKVIYAYFTCSISYTVHDLRTKLKSLIPEYMIPHYFIQVEYMPLNPNGKINKKELDNVPCKILTSSYYEAPSNEIETNLLTLWRQVLKGDSNMGVNEDFFEAGGHSLKVMAIISGALKYGYKLNINDIYKNPTVKKLANFILNNRHNYSINTIEELESLIREYDIDFSMKKIYEGEKEFRILLVNKAEDKLIKEITSKVNLNIRPHYIRTVGDLDFKDNDNCILDNFVSEFNESLNYNFKNIMNSPVVKEFNISGTQSIRLKNPEYVITAMNIETSDLDKIKEVLLKLINEQSLLRSTLKFADEKGWYWEMHENVDDINIPIIDLNKLSPKSHEDISKQCISVMLNTNKLMREDKPLLRAVIIKKNLIDNVIVIALDHLIADGFSSEVIKSRITELLSGSETLKDSIQFSDYVEMLSKGPLENEEDIVEEFKLKEFKDSLDKFNEGVKAFDCSEKTKINLDIEINEEDVFDKTFEALLSIIQKYLKVTKIPMVFINYGRKYKEYDYYNVIGELIDYIPLQIDTNDDCKKLRHNIEEKFKYVMDKNINFAQLIYDKKYKIISSLLNNLFESTFVVFNFQKRSGIKVKESLIYEKDDVSNNMNSIMFNAKADEGQIKIELSLPFKVEDTQELTSLITEKFKNK